MANAIWALTACDVADQLNARTLSPEQVLDSLSERISAVNPIVNALPTLCMERAYASCSELTNSSSGPAAPLFGLPVPIKDSYEVEGVRTTWGSLAFKDHIAARTDLAVASIERSGGIVYAKSNTPEFEAGASTFNEVFGRTLNPWNTGRSAAGSSGGAAVAVATGMAFFGQGSDFACSLRYPASFCGIVGLRPTPGLIPQGPGKLPYQALSVIGPLGRNVADTALGLDAMVGFDPGDPQTQPLPTSDYRGAGENPRRPEHIAFSMDLGVAVVSQQVSKIVATAIEAIAKDGCAVEEIHPDLSGCHDAFRPLRAFQFSALRADLLKTARDKLKPEVVWNIEQGLKLSAAELIHAEHLRAGLRQTMLAFLQTHEFLVTPTAPVAPNPAEERYVSAIEGVAMETYLDWLVLGYAVTVTGCPAISIPCGFTDDGLPVGLQIIGPPHSEAKLLAAAAWFEQVLDCSLPEPIDPRVNKDAHAGA